jgi:CRISPR-associated endonuclease/helicase Cas3
MSREDWHAFQAAWRLSGLPKGFRHEFVSVALLRSARDGLLAGLSADEKELVEYLIGVHHGRGRPFAPLVHDSNRDGESAAVSLEWEGQRLSCSAAHGLWKLDAGWTGLFWRLVRRYGFWALAYLEMILVLSDQARSREEEEQADE